MSFILQALKRAEEDRPSPPPPRPVAPPPPPSPARRLPWEWLAVASLALNLVVAGALLLPGWRAGRAPLPAPAARGPGEVAPPARAAPASPAPPTASAATAESPADRPVRESLVPRGRRDAAPAPRAAAGPAPEVDARRPRAAAPTDPGPGAAAPGAPPGPPAPASSSGAPPGPVAPGPTGPSESPRPAAGLRIDAHVWAPEPRDRMVFLNGRKYVEGQLVDGRLLLERITEDGVVLSAEGQRIRVAVPGR